MASFRVDVVTEFKAYHAPDSIKVLQGEFFLCAILFARLMLSQLTESIFMPEKLD